LRSVLHAENIARGGEWIETRIVNSGPNDAPSIAKHSRCLYPDAPIEANAGTAMVWTSGDREQAGFLESSGMAWVQISRPQ
jgi:hypothetical protein